MFIIIAAIQNILVRMLPVSLFSCFPLLQLSVRLGNSTDKRLSTGVGNRCKSWKPQWLRVPVGVEGLFKVRIVINPDESVQVPKQCSLAAAFVSFALLLIRVYV